MRTYYRYCTTMRPATIGAVPREGLIAVEDVKGFQVAPSGHMIYSVIDYNRPLTDEEVDQYELEFLHCVAVV